MAILIWTPPIKIQDQFQLSILRSSGDGWALAGLGELPQAQQEDRPLQAAVGHELDLFAPVPVAEHQQRHVSVAGVQLS